MKTKICIRCNKERTISEYYTHPKMKDGYLNKCKYCCKSQAKKRHHLKTKDPKWVEAERNRSKEKYKRLYSYENTKTYREKFPEKYYAKNAAYRLPLTPGKERHHWSYNQDHWKDIIELSPSDHHKLHQHMTYDQERMMFRISTTISGGKFHQGLLLNTKDLHIKYLEAVKKLYNEFH